MLRSLVTLPFLLLVQAFSRLFYRQEQQWVSERPVGDWPPFRIVAILNHTSLTEFLLSGQVPFSYIWRLARHGTVPIADVTLARPLVGQFWKMIAANPVAISRERDHTWDQIMSLVEDDDAMVMLLPEGRMKRGNGLDKKGRRMQCRSGVADLIRTVGDGKMLMAYSQGLHHIQVPDQGIMKLFKPVRLRLEAIDIAEYEARMSEGLDPEDVQAYRRRVMADFDARRDRYCTSDLGGTDRPEEWQTAETIRVSRAPVFLRNRPSAADG
ncbi:MAG: hypothetical protein AAGN46_11295 [Acidobacteriota bacterium]